MRVFVNLAVSVFATVALAAIAFAAGQELPAGEGKAVVEGKCTLCHDLAKVTPTSEAGS